MDNIKNILKNISKEDYNNKKVNLHLHTTFSDGECDCESLLKTAKENGFKIISITDHNTIDAHFKINDEILITGVEFDCWFKGVFIHLLAYNIDINNSDLKKYYSKNKSGTESVLKRLFSFRNVSDLIKAIHNAGGIAVLAHPACYWAVNLNDFVERLINIGLDGIEVYYPYRRFRKIVKFHTATSVKIIADNHPELIQTGGTDFHGKNFNED